MRIAWDNENAFWDAQITKRVDDMWLAYSEVPMPQGAVVTVTPLTGIGGPQFELEVYVVEQGEDVLVSPFSESRFWNKIRPVHMAIDAAERLFSFVKAA